MPMENFAERGRQRAFALGKQLSAEKNSGNVHALPDIILSAWILFRIKPIKCVRDFVAGVEKVL